MLSEEVADAVMPLESSMTVQGSGTNRYTITHKQNAVGHYFFCNCPSWRFMGGPPEKRQCKHVMRLLGNPPPETVSRKKKRDAEDEQPTHKRAKSAAVADVVTLAKEWTSEDPTDYWMSEKLDGMRAYWDGTALYTRTGNRIDAPSEMLSQLPAMPLDGELFIGRGKFQELMSITRRLTATLAEWSRVEYRIFDAPSVHGPFAERLRAASAVVSSTGAPWVAIHHHLRCKGVAHLKKELQRVVKLGGEGVMLRHPTRHYSGGRSTDLLKIKEFRDAEALVLGHEQGSGRNAGRLGALLCADSSGVQFKVGTGFPDALRDNPPKVGTVITYKYQELTLGGKPRSTNAAASGGAAAAVVTWVRPARHRHAHYATHDVCERARRPGGFPHQRRRPLLPRPRESAPVAQ